MSMIETTSVSQNQIYGLLGMPENCFYVVDNDHHIAKMMQMVLMEQRFLFCVNITKFFAEFDTRIINNENCHLYGCTPFSVKYVRFDADPKFYKARIIDTQGSHDSVFRKNLRILQKLLTLLEDAVKNFELAEKDRFQDEINGFKELEEFVGVLNPEDRNVGLIVKEEINERVASIQRARPFKADLLRLLMKIDYAKPDAIEQIKSGIVSLNFNKNDYILDSRNENKILLSDFFKKLLLTKL